MNTRSASDILRELISIRSDTGTTYECEKGNRIYKMILEDPYFKAHPELCGIYTEQDILKRPLVWALKKGASARTVILSGHYDTVEIESYGPLKQYALQPDILKEKLLESNLIDEETKKDIENKGWLMGRGSADCDSGIAESLYVLFNSTNTEGNILFTAVCDEENLSAGARQCVELYKELKDRFGLKYVFGVITEPDCFKDVGKPFNIEEGNVGKLQAVVVTKGIVSHGATMLYGLNPALITAEIVRKMELDETFHSCVGTSHTHPSTTLLVRDLKEHYDISLPKYTAAAFNILFHKMDVAKYVRTIRQYCEDATTESINRYMKTYTDMERAGAVEEKDRLELQCEVYTAEELKTLLKLKRVDFDSTLLDIESDITTQVNNGMTLQMASINYIKQLLDLYETTNPVTIVGFAPPFYPGIENTKKDPAWEHIIATLHNEMNEEGVALAVRDPYNPGPTDLCYMYCNDLEGSLNIMNNMCVPKELYDIDFKTIHELNIPSVLMGATGKDVHKISERVWIEDVDYKVPYFLNKAIDIAFRE